MLRWHNNRDKILFYWQNGNAVRMSTILYIYNIHITDSKSFDLEAIDSKTMEFKSDTHELKRFNCERQERQLKEHKHSNCQFYWSQNVVYSRTERKERASAATSHLFFSKSNCFGVKCNINWTKAPKPHLHFPFWAKEKKNQRTKECNSSFFIFDLIKNGGESWCFYF